MPLIVKATTGCSHGSSVLSDTGNVALTWNPSDCKLAIQRNYIQDPNTAAEFSN